MARIGMLMRDKNRIFPDAGVKRLLNLTLKWRCVVQLTFLTQRKSPPQKSLPQISQMTQMVHVKKPSASFAKSAGDQI